MYKSCNLVQHGLCFFDGSLAVCCNSPVDQVNGQMPPLIRNNYSGEIIPKEELFAELDKYANIFRDGGCPKECLNCYKIEEKEWDEDKYINEITIAHFLKCNADCIYCANNLSPEQRRETTYKIYPILKHYIEEGVIKKGCEFHISGGEFSIYNEANEILELIAVSGFAKVIIATNGIRYLESLFKALDMGNTYMCVSLDSGTRTTFKKIKRVDAFDKVVSNLSKYAATETSRNAIRLKYIIIPGVNDNIREFKKFLSIAKSLSVKTIIIDLEGRYSRQTNHTIDDYFIELALKMEKIAKNNDFNTELYQFFNQNTYRKDIKRCNFIVNFIKSLKYKYFSPEIKELYNCHNYGSRK